VSVVLRVPGVLSALITSCIAQIPMGALGLLFILHTRDVTGDYAAGGVVAGVYALVLGITNPVQARLADRRGQVGVLVLGAPVCAAAIVAQAVLPDDAPVWLRVVLAGVAGAAQPPVGSFRRRVWNVLITDDDLRHRAYATEGALLEFVYILGPVAVVAGVGSWSHTGAMVLCAVAILVGNLAFARHPAVRTLEGVPPTGHGFVGALRAPGVVVAAVVFLTLGVAVGAAEVGVPAALEEMQDRSLTGIALGLWGLGSMLGGIAMSRTQAPARPVRRLALFVAAWGVLHGLLAVASSPLVLCVGLLAAGATIAPTFTVLNGLLDQIALPGTLTEAFTWTSTGMMVGSAAGGALAGHLADSASAAAALAIGGVGVLGAVVLVFAHRTMSHPPRAAAAAAA
jgi:predicted MFS family arabinose efflux permease